MKEFLKKADLLGLALAASAMIAYSIRSVWTVYQTIIIVAGAALVVVSLILKAGNIRTSLRRRSARFGVNSATSVVLVVGILGLLNYLGAQHPKRLDMTTEKIHSLSDQSVQVADQVQQDVRIKAFYPGGDDRAVRDRLELYSNRNGKITFEFIDPDKQPQVAQQYQVTVYGETSNPFSGETLRSGTLILEMAGKTERIEKQSEPLREEDVTNALMKLVKGETKVIYFTEGHGEKRVADTDERVGYDQAGKELEQESYVIKPLNLVSEGKVPDDAAVVVMAGPQTEPFPNEMDMLDAYLNAGGSVLLMVDPPPAPSLENFTKKWSIAVGNNVVLDFSGAGRIFGTGPEIPLVMSYGSHKITERFNFMTIFPLARSVAPLSPAVEGVTTEQLLMTGERSWGETNLKSTEVAFDEKVDQKGPISIGVVASKKIGDNKTARLVVLGDSDFAANGFFGAQGNGNFFTNVVVWLAQDENFISIQPKNPTDRPLTMTESQGRTVSYLALLVLPGSILAAGVSVWMKRRK